MPNSSDYLPDLLPCHVCGGRPSQATTGVILKTYVYVCNGSGGGRAFHDPVGSPWASLPFRAAESWNEMVGRAMSGGEGAQQEEPGVVAPESPAIPQRWWWVSLSERTEGGYAIAGGAYGGETEGVAIERACRDHGDVYGVDLSNPDNCLTTCIELTPEFLAKALCESRLWYRGQLEKSGGVS